VSNKRVVSAEPDSQSASQTSLSPHSYQQRTLRSSGGNADVEKIRHYR